MSHLTCFFGLWGQREEITGFPVCTAVSDPSISEYTQSSDSLTSSWTHISSLMLLVKHTNRDQHLLFRRIPKPAWRLKLPACICQSASYQYTARGDAPAITEKEQSNRKQKITNLCSSGWCKSAGLWNAVIWEMYMHLLICFSFILRGCVEEMFNHLSVWLQAIKLKGNSPKT